jgi:ribose transport system permease protein
MALAEKNWSLKRTDIKTLLLRTGVFWTLILLVALLSFTTDQFLTVPNLLNVCRQVVITSILGIGGTFVIIGGGIDLSVGSLLALTAAYAAKVMFLTDSVLLSVLVAIVVGLFLGLFQGFLITRFNIAPFAVTLGGMSIFRGMTLLFTNGIPISKLPHDFRWFGSGMISWFPVPVLFLAIIALAGFFILSKTKIGRYVYAIGSNENTSRLSGINVKFYRLVTYGISGLCCAIAGIILTGRINSAHPYAGQGYELNAIAAVVIGGASLQGGKGTIFGTIIGALIIGVIGNGLNLLQINAFWQQVTIGAVIIIAVIIDKMRVTITESNNLAGD